MRQGNQRGKSAAGDAVIYEKQLFELRQTGNRLEPGVAEPCERPQRQYAQSLELVQRLQAFVVDAGMVQAQFLQRIPPLGDPTQLGVVQIAASQAQAAHVGEDCQCMQLPGIYRGAVPRQVECDQASVLIESQLAFDRVDHSNCLEEPFGGGWRLAAT